VSAASGLVELEIGPPAHGGSCVARDGERVVFVRHALPGERVVARITDETSRFARADAVEVLDASPHRVEARCPVARPGLCGGCDWQHADAPAQAALKAEVVASQLRRIGGVTREVPVERPAGDGFGWRTRVRFAVGPDGRAGFRAHRSHDVVPVDACPIAHALVEAVGVERREWNRATEIDVQASTASGEVVVRTTARRDGAVRTQGAESLTQEAAGRRFRVSAGAFWQVHPVAAPTLADAVVDGLAPRPGERALDLYAGVGLFAAAVGVAVAADSRGVDAGTVTAVESHAAAAADAVHNLGDLPGASVVRAATEAALTRIGAADIVVLDPPRTGAGAAVVEGISALRPRAVAYVACDPAALARDLATFARHGYGVDSLRGFDLFPQTHHVECVAILRPDAA
jgi:tRNA/tmRNA/rRNA uracil-C5-methylase (TrmA/RlmC/RlmD family)